MNVEPSKSGIYLEQLSIVDLWIDNLIDFSNSNFRNEIILFATAYSALNSLSWCFSSSNSDKDMINDLSNKISQIILPECQISKEILTVSQSIVSYTKSHFGDMHRLHTRRNGTGLGDVVRFPNSTQEPRKLSSIQIESLNDKQIYVLAMGILYQFRCNLVHGCKSFDIEENKTLSKYLYRMIILNFLLLPDRIFSNDKKTRLKQMRNLP